MKLWSHTSSAGSHPYEVPDMLPRCACGWHAQTVRHIFLQCPRCEEGRLELLRLAGSERLEEILSRVASAHAAARWLIQHGILQQFNTAREIEEEDTTDHTPLQVLDDVL